ncbi:hypothetical protein HYH03_016493 [Edaphochlamys debaryana]|uniref:Uncharacterized protein n=1 Tax=Edaphochlamys debaryana TaxID=47281 RepID=A0A835XM56_9CHLO|nr:hypothetical protein HYH03_016493 [Edaphochlamys debaryana]|eukprot:KAG2484746.1 hypothetical protein HYH03_016493 [Edaphochlamys debaryana]
MQYLKVDGTRIRYVGPGDDDTQAATVRANYPVPSDTPLYYFEVKVVDRGQDCFIGVGFCTEEVLLSRLPGWDPHSYAYHGDDGHAFAGSGMGRPYGPSYTTGDVVGALYDKAERTISYFKNGQPLGPAFRDVSEAQPLFPCVGLRTRGEEVVANFGAGPSGEPFRADFSGIKAAFQARVLAAVRSQEVPLLCSKGTPLLPQLMYDYLLHQRYWRTAAVLGRDLLRSAPPAARPGPTASGSGAGPSTSGGIQSVLDERELEDIAVRQQSYDLVAAGRIDEALALLKEKYPPQVLADRPALDFRLRVQKFVEMVHEACTASTASTASTVGTAPAAPTAAAPNGSAPATTAGDGVEGSGPSPMEHSEGDGEGEGERGEAEGGGSGQRNGGAGREAEGPAGPGPGSAAAAAAEANGSAARQPPPTTREILAYGTAELWPRCRTLADRDLLTDALSLLAFNDPAAAPAGYLLRPAHRVALAEELNGALLACRGLPATSPLERLFQHLAAALTELKKGDHPQALSLPDPRAIIMDPPPLGSAVGGLLPPVGGAGAGAAAGGSGSGAGAGAGGGGEAGPDPMSV